MASSPRSGLPLAKSPAAATPGPPRTWGCSTREFATSPLPRHARQDRLGAGCWGRGGPDRRARCGPTVAPWLAPTPANVQVPEVVLCLGLALRPRAEGQGCQECQARGAPARSLPYLPRRCLAPPHRQGGGPFLQGVQCGDATGAALGVPKADGNGPRPRFRARVPVSGLRFRALLITYQLGRKQRRLSVDGLTGSPLAS
jgi:hypothetical protein